MPPHPHPPSGISSDAAAHSSKFLLSHANTLSFKLIYPSFRVSNGDGCDTKPRAHTHKKKKKKNEVKKINQERRGESSGTRPFITQKDLLLSGKKKKKKAKKREIAADSFFLLSQVSPIHPNFPRILAEMFQIMRGCHAGFNGAAAMLKQQKKKKKKKC